MPTIAAAKVGVVRALVTSVASANSAIVDAGSDAAVVPS